MEQIVKYVNQRYKNTSVYVSDNGERRGHQSIVNLECMILCAECRPCNCDREHFFQQVTHKTAMQYGGLDR
jgi:hypothetical protein